MTAKSRHLRRELTALLLLATCASAQAAENEIKSGAVVELRYRHETVDDDAFTRTAQADTLRLRLGYLWAFAPSWQAYADAERVQTLFGDDFNSTANGETGYPTVADPQATEINQAFVRYSGSALGATLGRHRVLLDNQRFFGNSGWRQNEQTFDGLSLGKTFQESGTALNYSWLGRVLRVNGHNNPNPLLREWDLNGHLINLSQPLALGKLTAYAYLVENHDRQDLSSRTAGARWNADMEREGVQPGWTIEYAHQSDYADNPFSFSESYRLIEARLRWSGVTFKLGQEVLGGNGQSGFSTPYASLHAFNGWADRFGNTPANGLDDRFVGAEGKFGKASWTVRWHDFQADRGGGDYGHELDASVSYPLWKGVTGMLKVADYRSDGFASDTRKLWFSLDYRL